MSCVIEGCKSHSSRMKNIAETLSFHVFPKNYELKNTWIRQISRLNWTPKKHSRICSKHFTPDSFWESTDYKQKRLKEGAIPTLHLPDRILVNEQVGHLILSDHHCPWTPAPPETLQMGCQPKEEPLFENDTDVDYCPKKFEPNSDEVCNESKTMDRMNQLLEIKSENDGNPRYHLKTMNPNSDGCSSTNSNFMKSEVYEKKIRMLEKELDRVNKISKRRLQKINTLTKRIKRVKKQNEGLYTILIERSREENVETD